MKQLTRRPSQLDELDVLTARLSPAGLAWVAGGRATDPDYGWVPFPHLELLSEKLMAAAAGEINRLIVTMPPRHGKSEMISRFFPAWYLGTHPEGKVMLASYESTFARSWGRKARQVMDEYGASVFGTQVSQSSSAADFWELEDTGGVMVTAGVGGGLTGKGADLLIIDDPVKNAEESMSAVMREKAWDWWLSTARTRLQRNGSAVIVMTRWHEDDLAGKLLKEAEGLGDQWEVLNLPSMAIEGDALGRKPGEVLCPGLFDEEATLQTKAALGAYFWSALYQQSPTPDEGGIFNRQYFRYFELRGGQVILDTLNGKVEYPASSCRKVSYVDLAESLKKTADYTVLTEAWITPGQDLLIMNVTRDRIPGSEQPQFFIDHYVGQMKIESIGYQSSLGKGLLRRGYPVEAVYPDKDKVTRASAAGVLYRGAKIFHRRGAEYLAEFEAELLAFPAGEHDDMVDTVAYAAKDLPTISTETVAAAPKKGKTMTGGVLTQEM